MTSKSQDKQNKAAIIDDHMTRLYDFKKRLGKGAYGIVWKALDKRNNHTVAVKKIFDAFRDETDAQRTFREIVFLKAFRNHANVVSLLNIHKASNNLDMYLVFEYMESDLHNIIKKGSILRDVHKRYIMYQLINAVRFIHSGNVIHRDLKPCNILIDNKCRCKLADFGLARSVASQIHGSSTDMPNSGHPGVLLTDYVATRWYRAPEILVASKKYTKGIDMWSLGCIMGEMLSGKPLFQGSSTVNQIEKIVATLPDITDEDILAIGGGFGTALLNQQSQIEKGPTLEELLDNAPEDALHMVKSLLLLDPLARLTANEAIQHAYVEKFRNTSDEIELNVDIVPPFSDDVRLNVHDYRDKVYEMANISPYRTQTRPSSKQSNNSKIIFESSKKMDQAQLKKVGTLKKGVSNPSIQINEKKVNPVISRNLSQLQMKPKVVPGVITSKLDLAKSTSNSSLSRESSSKSIDKPDKCIYKPCAGAANKIITFKKITPPTEPPNAGQACSNNKIASLPKQSKKYSQIPVNSRIEQIHLQNIQKAAEAVVFGNCSVVNNHNPQANRKYSLPTAGGGSSSNQANYRKYDQTQFQQARMVTSTQNFDQHTLMFTNNKHTQNIDFQKNVPSMANSSKYSTGQARNGKSPDQSQPQFHSQPQAIPSKVVKNGGEGLCYEKRLRRLEEEIERYKSDVNSFCKQSGMANEIPEKNIKSHAKAAHSMKSHLKNNLTKVVDLGGHKTRLPSVSAIGQGTILPPSCDQSSKHDARLNHPGHHHTNKPKDPVNRYTNQNSAYFPKGGYNAMIHGRCGAGDSIRPTTSLISNDVNHPYNKYNPMNANLKPTMQPTKSTPQYHGELKNGHTYQQNHFHTYTYHQYKGANAASMRPVPVAKII